VDSLTLLQKVFIDTKKAFREMSFSFAESIYDLLAVND
jgi:hypothetical protein